MGITDLSSLVSDFANALVAIDKVVAPWKNFHPGVGPYGEPQLNPLIVQTLSESPKYKGRIKSQRYPDILIKDEWAIEVKIARPFGDNGKEAENWSVNLLHPYSGHASSVSDCMKLRKFMGPERRAVVVVGYEHDPPQVEVEPLLRSFEVIAHYVFAFRLGGRVQERRRALIHPVHQQLLVAAWEVFPEDV